jgi:hypothetical protein
MCSSFNGAFSAGALHGVGFGTLHEAGCIMSGEWSEETMCRVCGYTLAGMDDMCPKRDKVCVYCCLRCDPHGGCGFEGSRDSVEDTTDSHADWERVQREWEKKRGSFGHD